MIHEHVRLLVAEGQGTAFETALLEVRRRVFASPGFRGFTVVQGVEQRARYLVQVLWETPDEVIDHVESGRLERCWAPVTPFVVGRPDVEHFVERPGLASQGPGLLADLDLSWLTEPAATALSAPSD